MMKILNKMTIFCLFFISSSNVFSENYGGVEFPDGSFSFADSVISYTPGSDVGATSEGTWNNPAAALGIPDRQVAPPETGVVSLGDNGVLVLRFTDNSLTTSGNSSKDLWIFEVGGKVETFNVAISKNNVDWIDLGNISGQPTGIDIDAVMGVTAGEHYNYVKLSDVSPNQSGSPYGEADIDAVGAVSSVPGDINSRRGCVHPSKLTKTTLDLYSPSEDLLDGTWEPPKDYWKPLDSTWSEWDSLKDFSAPSKHGRYNAQLINNNDYSRGKLNVDQYEIRLDSLGDDPIEFFSEFRSKLPSMIYGRNLYSSLDAYDNANKEKWKSRNPLGALMTFTLAIGQDGSVVVSCNDELSFIFSTVITINDHWHPVSGNRGFGLEVNEDGSFKIFVKAADRASRSPANLLMTNEQIFNEGDKVWRQLISNIYDHYYQRNPQDMRKVSQRLDYTNESIGGGGGSLNLTTLLAFTCLFIFIRFKRRPLYTTKIPE